MPHLILRFANCTYGSSAFPFAGICILSNVNINILFSDVGFQEMNAILGEKLTAEDEEEVLAEFENLEAQVCLVS